MGEKKMGTEHLMKHIKIYGIYYIYFVLTLMCIYVCFGNLDVAAVQHWDEARHGVNAYEMLKEGNFIVNTYNYENDYYNLKPPLGYWGVMIGYKLFGTNVFGMRFFFALSTVLTFLVIAFYLHRKAGKTAAVSSMLFFLTCKEMIFEHCGRNADADAMYILFFTIGCLCLIESVKNIRYLYLCGFLFSLCFLAKSWHACVLLPIGGLFILFSGLIKRMKLKEYLIFFGAAFLPILLWAAIRFSYDGTAFLGQMFGVDVTERVSFPVSANEDGLFYIKYIMSTNAGLLLVLSISFAGFYLFFMEKFVRGTKRKVGCSPSFLAVVLWIFITLIIFSITRADNYWYIFPVYPGLCVGAALLLQNVADRARESGGKWVINGILGAGAAIVLLVGIDTALNIKDLERSSYQLDLACALETHPELHGLKIFVEKSNNEYKESFYWEQAGILIAELSGDMKCEEGGVEAYLKEEERALMVVDHVFFEQYKEEFEASDVVYQNEYIVLKNFAEQR